MLRNSSFCLPFCMRGPYSDRLPLFQFCIPIRSSFDRCNLCILSGLCIQPVYLITSCPGNLTPLHGNCCIFCTELYRFYFCRLFCFFDFHLLFCGIRTFIIFILIRFVCTYFIFISLSCCKLLIGVEKRLGTFTVATCLYLPSAVSSR